MVVSKSTCLLVTLVLASGCAEPNRPLGFDAGGPAGSGGPTDAMAGAVLDLTGVVNDFAPPADLAPPPDLTPACVDANTPCSTGNPGACGVGHSHCVGSVLTCVPDVTSQTCYTGAPATQGHGLCKPGTQACIGTLGECIGQVLPSREDCFNNLDDDCDDRVDNGCPSTVYLGTPRALPSLGGTGGDPVSARCPTNSYVVKTQILFSDSDSSATGVRVFCAAPSLVRGTASYSIKLTPVSTSASASFQGSRYNLPDEEVNCGTTGFVGGWTTGGWSNNFVHAFWINCANGTLTLNSDNTLSYSLAKNGVGGSVGYQQGAAFEDACGQSEVLVGFDGRVGDYMDQLTPICAPLQTLYK